MDKRLGHIDEVRTAGPSRPENALLMGAFADDLTGAVELASMLVSQGIRTGLALGANGTIDPACQAQVFALRTRVIARDDALAAFETAYARLAERDPLHAFFKYCATFDSTPQGNIGPCAELLLDRLGSDFTLFCPSFWQAGRHVFQGHLFAGRQILSESPKRFDPLTPMTDSNLLRVLAAQSRRKVDLIPLEIVRRGPAAVAARIRELRAAGVGLAIADATEAEDVASLAAGAFELRLLTGNSGLAGELAAEWRRRALVGHKDRAAMLPAVEGRAVVLAGSCAERTEQQLEAFARQHPVLRIDMDAACRGEDVVSAALAWAVERLPAGPMAIATTMAAADVQALQNRYGVDRVARMAEAVLSRLAGALVHEHGVRRMLVAGGETSGAILKELGIGSLEVGPFEEPGLSRSASAGADPLAFILKSGKLGPVDMFAPGLEALRRPLEFREPQ